MHQLHGLTMICRTLAKRILLSSVSVRWPLPVSQVPRLVTNIRKIRKFSRKLLNSAVLRSVTSGFQASLSPNHLRKLRKSSVHSLLSWKLWGLRLLALLSRATVFRVSWILRSSAINMRWMTRSGILSAQVWTNLVRSPKRSMALPLLSIIIWVLLYRALLRLTAWWRIQILSM